MAAKKEHKEEHRQEHREGVGGPGGGPGGGGLGPPPPPTVNITVNTLNGDMTYAPALLHAKPGDVITWGASGPIAIQFKGISPIAWDKTQPVPTGTVLDTAGVFSYACAVAIGEKVYLDASCPVLVVDP